MPRSDTLLLLDAPQVSSLLNPASVTSAVREAFALHSSSRGRVFPVVREKLPSGVFGIKSGDVADQSLLGFKAAGFWPANRARGGEPHQATIVLVDPATGRPLCIMDGNIVTTLRTGAAGALGIDLLSPKHASTLCTFGTGVQATIQTDLALATRPIKELRYLSSDASPRLDFESKFSSRCKVLHETDPDRAVAASQVIITATPGRSGALFEASSLQPGAHINAVGSDTVGKRELPDLPNARWFADDRAQSAQLGERQWLEVDCQELGEVLDGIDHAEADITVFDMTGLALQDLTTARQIYDLARARNVGTTLPWPW